MNCMLVKLFKVKSLVTIFMTLAMIAMLFINSDPPQEILALFCTSYGSIVTYFFTKKDSEEGESDQK